MCSGGYSCMCVRVGVHVCVLGWAFMCALSWIFMYVC
jgi:hypothetical protein